MKRVCSYCGTLIGTIEDSSNHPEAISHGICPDCVHQAVAGTGAELGAFLDRLPGPVFVVDAEGRIVAANAGGRELVRPDHEQLAGRLGGEVFECKHAKLPGGCGQTIHCKSCTIRQTVNRTHATGEPCTHVPAYMDLGDLVDSRRVRFLISTEKAGDVVLLRIDEVAPVSPPGSGTEE